MLLRDPEGLRDHRLPYALGPHQPDQFDVCGIHLEVARRPSFPGTVVLVFCMRPETQMGGANARRVVAAMKDLKIAWVDPRLKEVGNPVRANLVDLAIASRTAPPPLVAPVGVGANDDLCGETGGQSSETATQL